MMGGYQEPWHLKKLKQKDLKFEYSLVFIAISRPAGAIETLSK